jgi:phosphatidate cytidylyltransferase
MIKSSKQKWRDLGPRVTSAVVMLVIGVLATIAGHGAFTALVCIAGLIGVWEFYMMIQAKRRNGALSRSDYVALTLYFTLFALGILGLIGVSERAGRVGVVYIVSLVVITDTLGYFAGRSFGGRKFWPSISPKKTWAGVLGGWAGVVLLSVAIGAAIGIKPLLGFAIASVLLSFASQLGDIAQSAVKRRMGVKDSSNIIPGHGGVLDRFDALLAVGALFFVLNMVV